MLCVSLYLTFQRGQPASSRDPLVPASGAPGLQLYATSFMYMLGIQTQSLLNSKHMKAEQTPSLPKYLLLPKTI